MYANNYGQTMLVTPETPFAAIRDALSALGWQQAEDRKAHSSLIVGEPEHAAWSRQGQKPYVIYTFNPVVKLRVLDVATCPPVMRAAIASKLCVLDDEKVTSLLDAPDLKARLLGLMAAQETERLDLLRQTEALTRDRERIVSKQAAQVYTRLKQVNEARYELMANLRVLSETAPSLISKLSNRNFVQSLKPTPSDLSELFDESFAPTLTRAVDAIYKKRLRVLAISPEDKLDVFVAPAGLLRWSNQFSDKFPQGYRDIAGWMNPSKVWMAWTHTASRGGTVRYDGLVWLDRRWVWLPKIFRYIVPFLLETSDLSRFRH